MDIRDLERYRRRLLGARPASPAARRAAAQALARDGSPAAVRALLDAVLEPQDPEARDHALFALRHLADWRCINAVCAAWAATRNEDLAALMLERRWVASAPPTLRVLSALRAGRDDLLAQSRPSVVLPLLQACDDRDAALAGRARATLIRLARPETREALCRLAVERDMPAAREAAVVAGFTPRHPAERALFLFLTAQWQPYRQHDPDGSLLGAAYAAAPAALRERIVRQAQRARYTSWARTAAATRRRLRPHEMTDAEWAAAADELASAERHDELWALAQAAAPVRAAPLVRRLAAAGWAPEARAARERFEEAARAAADAAPPAAAHPAQALEAHARAVGSMALSPDGRLLATGGAEGTLRLWHLPGGAPVGGSRRHPWAVSALSFSADGALLASASPVGAVHVWRTGGEPGDEPLATLEGRHPALFLPRGRLLATGGADGAVRIWRVPGAAAPAELRGHLGKIGCLAASPDGALLASAGLGGVALVGGARERVADRSVRLWRLPEGSVAGVLDAGPAPAEQLAFGPDGRLLAAAGELVRVWSAADGMLLAELPCRAPVAWSPDGTLLAATGHDGRVQLWLAAGGHAPAALSTKDTAGDGSAAAACLAWSPDGRLLAVGRGDGQVELRLLPEGRALATLAGGDAAATTLAFSRSGALLVAGDAGGEVRIWTLGSAALAHTPAGALGPAGAARAKEALADSATCAEDRPWLTLALALAPQQGRQRQRRDRAEPEVRRITLASWDVEL